MACIDCHDPLHGYIDSRIPDNVSLAAPTVAPGQWTARNSMTLLDVSLKQMLGKGQPVFTWLGKYTKAGDVLELAITKPMASTPDYVEMVVQSDGNYLMLYNSAFAGSPNRIFDNLKIAFDAYLATKPFVTTRTDFDRWLLGETNSLSDSAKRGFGVFVGKGTCIECHNGPLLSDLAFHNTGVPQTGPPVPDLTMETGRAAVTKDPADTGKFLTGTLRDISATGPYMHDGAFATLRDVIDFYRGGGFATGYGGTRDPRITPLDLTDQDALDLETFLRALSDMDCDDSGNPACIGSGSGMGSAGGGSGGGPPADAGPPACTPPTMMCGSGCVDVQVDMMNCGTCGHACAYPMPNCVMGVCGP